MTLFLETRRSSENDTQSCDVPGFLKLGWSFKQLPKVRGSVRLEMAENGLLVPGATFLMCDWFMSCLCLPQLLPIMSDMEYLQDQHLLLSVKSCDGFESYGWSQ